MGQQRFTQVDPGAAAMTVRAGDQRAGRRLRFLFALWESAGATPVVARLIARSHEVTVLGPTTIEARMRTIGCDFVADTAMSHYDSRTDYPPDEVLWARDNVWLGGALGQARASVGLEPIASVPDQATALDRVLVLSINELADDAFPLPANTRYVGPPPEVTVPPHELSGAGDIVLISFSTGNMDQAGVLQRVADAAAGLPVRAVLTLGPAMQGADLVLASNVTAYDYLPHRAVLPGASATVTHPGHGTVMASLAHGVPLILMPMGRDQHVVAQRVVARGAGILVEARADAGGRPRAAQPEPSEQFGRHRNTRATRTRHWARRATTARSVEWVEARRSLPLSRQGSHEVSASPIAEGSSLTGAQASVRARTASGPRVLPMRPFGMLGGRLPRPPVLRAPGASPAYL